MKIIDWEEKKIEGKPGLSVLGKLSASGVVYINPWKFSISSHQLMHMSIHALRFSLDVTHEF